MDGTLRLGLPVRRAAELPDPSSPSPSSGSGRRRPGEWQSGSCGACGRPRASCSSWTCRGSGPTSSTALLRRACGSRPRTRSSPCRRRRWRSSRRPRDLDYLRRSLPDPDGFRVAHRFVTTWARSRGIYAARFGYLGGFHVSLLLARVCKLLTHDGAPGVPLPSVPDILSTFFGHYARLRLAAPSGLRPFLPQPTAAVHAVAREGAPRHLGLLPARPQRGPGRLAALGAHPRRRIWTRRPPHLRGWDDVVSLPRRRRRRRFPHSLQKLREDRRAVLGPLAPPGAPPSSAGSSLAASCCWST